MAFVYHAVPKQMIGDKLIPLNQMEGEFSELRKQYTDNYHDRMGVMDRKITMLECLWNDVVQFLPLHPKKVFELQMKLGLIPNLPPYKFFEIDLAHLNPEKTVVYFKSGSGEENVEVKWLKDVDIDDLQEIPEASVAYFESLIGTGELPFNYQFIPHILTMDRIDVSGATVFELV